MNNELRRYYMHPIEGATLQVQVQKQYLQFIRNRPDKGSWYNIKPSNASILNTVHYHLKCILLYAVGYVYGEELGCVYLYLSYRSPYPHSSRKIAHKINIIDVLVLE